ncbi:MAG: homogentisate 1,2-dioxygenase [Candidatus Dadabacteria bacterium]|nr:MAG: homogentisate 1,2-dioxygenase [Candidatus Dadabacteria bacterium]
MPFYHTLGRIPHKRHTCFRKPDGSLYREEVVGTRGFSGIYSILYHCSAPTRVIESKLLGSKAVEYCSGLPLEHRHIVTKDFRTSGDPVDSRIFLMGNKDLRLGLATPDKEMNYFYRNGLCDECLFVHYGSGTLHTQFGKLEYRAGDYIVIPVGTTYQIKISENTKFLVIEANSRFEFPRRYRNEYGQLLEHSPFCERDIRIPRELETYDEQGEYEVRIKLGDKYSMTILDHHPFDLIGWDGYLYPWIFNIEDFEPITGRVHQPPPVHQTFEGQGFVVCSFCPRLFDYHPEAIPAPYAHSNVNSDEVLYYVEGNFMSRKGIDVGSFTLHPAGIPHGPHPGTIEKSIGAKKTEELAVMVDTFAPLQITQTALDLCDPNYMKSWLGA